MTIGALDLLFYAGAILILFLTPGPVWVALTARAMSGGFASAAPLAVGVALGGYALAAGGHFRADMDIVALWRPVGADEMGCDGDVRHHGGAAYTARSRAYFDR